MSAINLNLVMNDLDSTQIDKQIPAIEEAATIVNELAIKAVQSLLNSSNPFLVAERLNRFGSIIVPHLEKLLQESDNSEVNILASLVLLQLNSQVGIPILLAAIKDDDEYAILAAQHLAKAGIKDTIKPICNRLRNSKLEEIDLIVGLLAAMAKLDDKLPQDLWKLFTGQNTPWQIQTVCSENFPSQPNNFDNELDIDSIWNYIATPLESPTPIIETRLWVSISQQQNIIKQRNSLLTAN